MVMVRQDVFPPKGYYIDGKYKEQLDIIRKTVEGHDRDVVIIYCGDVGDGKSTKCAQDLKYFDPTFEHTRMCQTEGDFQERIPKLNKYQAIALDESFEGLSSTQVASRVHRILVNLLQIVRQQNLYIGLVLPNYFDLSKTVAIFRSKWLVQVYSYKGQRGRFKVWGKDRKRELYVKGKKSINYHCVRPNMRGRFVKFMPIDEKKYKAMKYKALRDSMNEESALDKRTTFAKKTRDKAIKQLKKDGMIRKDLAELFGLSLTTIDKVLSGKR